MVKKDNIEIITKKGENVDVEVVGYKVSYFVFALFTSMVFIFFVHKGFQPIDIVTIPIFTLVIYFIMVYFAEIQSKKNKETFITENYINHNESIPSIQDIMEQYQSNMPGEEVQQEMNNTTPEEMPIVPVATEEYNLVPEEENYMYPQMNMEEQESEVILVDEASSGTKNNNTYTDKKQAQIRDMNRKKDPNMNNNSDDSVQPININISYNNNRPVSINDFPSMKVGVEGLKKGDENQYRFDTGLRPIENKTNNNNNFVDNNNSRNNINNSRVNMMLNSGNNNELLAPTKKKQTASSVPPPVNDFTRNLALSDMNQAYYPQYLENPLNKDKNPMDIHNILEESKTNKLKQLYNNGNNDTIVNPEQWKKYFAGNETDTICGKDNAPCPVMLNNYWSEYKPVESED